MERVVTDLGRGDVVNEGGEDRLDVLLSVTTRVMDKSRILLEVSSVSMNGNIVLTQSPRSSIRRAKYMAAAAT